MIILESNNIAGFLIEHKLTGSHCTIHIDRRTLSVDYLFVDDVCTYQLHEERLSNMYLDPTDSNVFSFEVPKIIQFMLPTSTIKFTTQNASGILEVTCNRPNFSAIVKCDNNHIDKLSDIDGDFIPFKPYAPVLKAIKSLKSLASELSNVVTVELGEEFWTVSVSQSCIFGAAKGLKGMIPSNLFEKIYDFHAEVCQTSKTSITVRKQLNFGYYILRIPISNSIELPNVVPKMVANCRREVCSSRLTQDVASIIGEIIKNVKKETIQVKFSDGRIDLIYVNNQINLTTVPAGTNTRNGIMITVPIKALIGMVNILDDDEETLVSTNGELICLMRGTQGLLISGMIS